jgi:hypothetical protein
MRATHDTNNEGFLKVTALMLSLPEDKGENEWKRRKLLVSFLFSTTAAKKRKEEKCEDARRDQTSKSTDFEHMFVQCKPDVSF